MSKRISSQQVALMENNRTIRIGRFHYFCEYLETLLLQEEPGITYEGKLAEVLQQADQFSEKYTLASSQIVTNALLRARRLDQKSQQTRARVIENTRGRSLKEILTNSVLAVLSQSYDQMDSRLRRVVDKKREKTNLDDWWLFLSFLGINKGVYSAKSHFWLRKIDLIGSGKVFGKTDSLYLLNKGREQDVREFFSVISGVPKAYVDDKLGYCSETEPTHQNSVLRTGSVLSGINPIYIETNESGKGEFSFIIDASGIYTGISVLFKTGLKHSSVLQSTGYKSRFFKA